MEGGGTLGTVAGDERKKSAGSTGRTGWACEMSQGMPVKMGSDADVVIAITPLTLGRAVQTVLLAAAP